jgi:hypothetical protein
VSPWQLLEAQKLGRSAWTELKGSPPEAVTSVFGYLATVEEMREMDPKQYWCRRWRAVALGE